MTLSCCSMSSSPDASIETARPSLAEFCEGYLVSGCLGQVVGDWLFLP